MVKRLYKVVWCLYKHLFCLYKLVWARTVKQVGCVHIQSLDNTFIQTSFLFARLLDSACPTGASTNRLRQEVMRFLFRPTFGRRTTPYALL